MKSGAKPVSIASTLLLQGTVLFAFTISVHGQTSPTKPNQPNQLPGMQPRAGIDQPSIRHREMIMRSLENEGADPMPTAEAKLAQAQIAKDFRQMQELNNAILSAKIPSTEADYSKLAQSTSEIKACAGRLKSNLGLAMVGKESEKAKRRSASNAAEMKTDLLSLDRLIMSFVHNPIFTKLQVLDAEHAVKARSDLEAIFELSRSISKDAQRLKESAKKP